jgi:hypothetical protein
MCKEFQEDLAALYIVDVKRNVQEKGAKGKLKLKGENKCRRGKG